jgi:predicted N-acyltransferase
MSYFKGYSIPNVFLDLPYKTYHEYLNNLKYGYRRQIKSSLKKIGATEPSDIFDSSRKTYFRIRPILECEPEEFHKLYMSVINRARIKLETLNLEFFVTLFKDQMDEIRSIELVDNDKLITAFIVAHQNDSLIFLWTAKEYDKDALDSYQNVMQAMIEYAIKSGCKRVVLGQTSYYPKMKVGGKTEELYILFKCHKKVKNMILKSLSNHIFPKFKVDKLHALKQ